MSDHSLNTTQARTPASQVNNTSLPENTAPLSSRTRADVEIDLFDLLRVSVKNWKTVVAITFVFTIISTITALMATPIYRAEVLAAPVSADDSRKIGMGAFASQLGGLASIAGISMPNGGDVETTIATLKSRKFINGFVGKEKLKSVLFADRWDSESGKWIIKKSLLAGIKKKLIPSELQPSDSSQGVPGEPSNWEAYALFKKQILSVKQDLKTGLITIAVEWSSPQLAAKWANQLVDKLNSEMRQKAIEESERTITYLNEQIEQTSVSDMRSIFFRLIEEHTKTISLAKINKQFAIKVIDPAVPPMERVKPQRSVMVILGFILGGMFGIFTVFVRQFFVNFKETHS